MLPPKHLVPSLQAVEQQFFNRPPLQTVRFIALAQKQLAEQRRMEPSIDDSAIERWQDLLWGKWLDPVMAIMACYELLRAGEPIDPVVSNNLQQSYGQLPDVAAIQTRVGGPVKWPDAVPMFLTGVRTFPELQLPLPKGKLDFSSPWTSWIGAVR